MAYKDSGPLHIDYDGYRLGDYYFNIRVTPDPGESTTGINARCYNFATQEMARVASEVTGTVESWSVEANETEASVYVTVQTDNLPTNFKGPGEYARYDGRRAYVSSDANVFVGYFLNKRFPSRFEPFCIGLSAEDVAGGMGDRVTAHPYEGGIYWFRDGYGLDTSDYSCEGPGFGKLGYGDYEYMDVVLSAIGAGAARKSNILVARFAIDIREAGGGPDGDWDEPGDTGDPSYTLNVNVTGASAGTHDAAAVPMAPADQPVYGSGGAGGNGGGGSAGQSTAIVRRFATEKAGSVNQEVTLRPPGVGSNGGPGGRGGDGCILIFY